MSTQTLHVVARIRAKPDAVETLGSVLKELAAATRGESGCISYRLFQNQINPVEFATVEEWVDASAEAAHMHTEHVKKAFGLVPALLAGAPDMQRYSEVI